MTKKKSKARIKKTFIFGFYSFNKNFSLLFYYFTIMAVPKKRTSKSKKNLRKINWKRKALTKATEALSKAKSILKLLSDN